MSKAPTTSSSKALTELLDPEFLTRLDSLDVFSRKILQGKLQGERRSKRRGQSVEFADHRPYVVGDDLRFVDWNVYGRLEQLFLKLFVEEQDLTVHIALDASSSIAVGGEGEAGKDRYIRTLAAALGYVGLVNNNRVTVSTFADGLIGQVANLRGRHCVHQLAEFLLAGSAEGPSFFDKACRQMVAGRMGSGLMIVLSDFLFKEGFTDGLRRLISRKYDLYVVQVLGPQELEPEFSGDLRLVDVEDDDMAEVTLSAALLSYYKKNLTAYCNELKGFCTSRGATYPLANSADPVEALVLNYLRRIGMLR